MFVKSNLISRPGYSGMGGILDTIGSAVGGVVNWFGTTQRTIGAQQQQAADLQAAYAAQQGPSTTTIILIGGIGVLAFMMMKKRKARSESAA
ncbi:MAG TPA: hypothetical protein VGM94_01055 [Galbitalea sp.]|jgi:hypothetical protein